MEEDFVRIIAKVSAYIILIPTILAIMRLRDGDREQRLLSLLIFSSLFVELTALIIGLSGEGENNLFLLHIFTVIEFTLLTLIFQPHVKVLIPKKAIHFLIAAFFLFAVINSLFFESIQQFNAFGRALEGLLIIFLDLLCLVLILKTLKIKQPECSPLIWISIGTLIYFSGSLFVFIFSNYVLSSQSVSVTIWGIHAFMSIVLNLFYTVALWVKPKA